MFVLFLSDVQELFSNFVICVHVNVSFWLRGDNGSARRQAPRDGLAHFSENNVTFGELSEKGEVFGELLANNVMI